MDDVSISQLTDILLASHGAKALRIAHRRAARCKQRRETEWATIWWKVAVAIEEREATRDQFSAA